VAIDFRVETVRKILALRHVGATCIRGDREAGRNGHAQLRHLGKARTLAAEQFPSAVGRFVEVVDVARGAQGGDPLTNALQ
jgi:hypothetical protein